MSNLVERIDAEIERRSVLKHPFYQMWSEGKLDIESLRVYSKEYFQMVKAVPKFVVNVSRLSAETPVRDAVAQNLMEESEHLEPWVRFAVATGVPRDELVDHNGSDTTRSAVSDLMRLTASSFEEGVAAMYAYEKELPKVSKLKIEGLRKFYGLNNGDATNYFEIHERVDVGHAAVWRAILNEIPEEKEELVLCAAVRSLEAQNKILDSVMEKLQLMSCAK